MKIGRNIGRKTSFLVILFVYVFALAVGILVYDFLDYDLWLKILFADIAATIATFIFSLLFRNASVYDPYWSVQPILIVFLLCDYSHFSATTLLPLIAISVWGLRLTANWAYTFHGLQYQDWRYTMLHEKTGVFYPIINFIGIHLVPTLVVYLATMPAVFVVTTQLRLNIWAVLGFIVSILAVLLQGISDVQMQAYRKNKKGAFIRNGLWKYSRHPNYLGEILMWWGIGLYAFALIPSQWWLLTGAVANTALFFFVSIPMADKRQAKKRGFAKYKRETRMLLPIKKFRKK